MKLTEEEQALRDLVFWEQLQGCQIERVEQAFELARSRLDFFPTVNAILNFMEEIAEQEYRNSPVPEAEQIAWRQPTEEGRTIAKAFIQEIYAHVDEINAKKEEERRQAFERKREALKKQAKLMGVR